MPHRFGMFGAREDCLHAAKPKPRKLAATRGPELDVADAGCAQLQQRDEVCSRDERVGECRAAAQRNCSKDGAVDICDDVASLGELAPLEQRELPQSPAVAASVQPERHQRMRT